MAVIRWSPPLISPPGRSDPQIARIDHHHLPPPWRLSPGAGLFQPGCESPDTGLFCQKDPTQAATNSSAPARMHVARRRSVPARMRIAGHRSVLPEGSYTSSYKFFRPGPDARHQAPVCSSPDAVAGHRSVLPEEFCIRSYSCLLPEPIIPSPCYLNRHDNSSKAS